MKDALILKAFGDLNVWTRGSERAPHKPLLILLALGGISRGEPRLLRFRDVDSRLRQLLAEFGPSRRSYHSEYPFWRLQNDHLWFIEGADRFAVRQGSTDAKKSDLLRLDARGGFKPEVHAALTSDPVLLKTVARQLLEAHFPPSIHEDILLEVGLDLDAPATEGRKRSSDFRREVLDAYEHMCTVCHASVRLQDRTIGLEAAHIKWHQAGGPETRDNGLALCSIHHKMFDLGTFTLTPEHCILVSELVSGNKAFKAWLGRFHEAPARHPVNRTYLPRKAYLDWHRREVFRAPPRESTPR